MEHDFDRRSEGRIPLKNALRLDYVGYRPVVRDLNLLGAYIEDARSNFSLGRVLELRIWLDEKTSITVKAMVRRVDEKKGVAVEFVEMSENDRAQLRRFVARQGAADSTTESL